MTVAVPLEVQDGASRNPKPDTYETSDVKLAAILREIGHKLVNIRDRKSGDRQKLLFVFAHSDVKDDIQKIINGEVSLPALRLLNTYDDLRGVMFNRKGFK